MNEMFKRSILAAVERIDTPVAGLHDPLLVKAGLIALRYLCVELADEHVAIGEIEMARDFLDLAKGLRP